MAGRNCKPPNSSDSSSSRLHSERLTSLLSSGCHSTEEMTQKYSTRRRPESLCFSICVSLAVLTCDGELNSSEPPWSIILGTLMARYDSSNAAAAEADRNETLATTRRWFVWHGKRPDARAPKPPSNKRYPIRIRVTAEVPVVSREPINNSHQGNAK